MGKKSRAEIQKAYRERKKLESNGEAFMEKERERKRKAYVKVSELDTSALKRRRMEVNGRVRRFREKKQREKLTMEENKMGRTRASKKVSPAKSPRLLVKFDFSRKSRKSQGGKKRESRALSKARRKIQHLEEKNKQQLAKLWKLQKRLQRSEKASNEKSLSQPSSSSSSNSGACNATRVPATTPRSRMRADLSEAGITPDTVSQTIRKKLIFANAIMNGTKDTSTSDKKTKAIISGVLSGKIVKRYRLLSMIKKNTGLRKRSLYIGSRFTTKQRLPLIRNQLKESVIKFLEREDNSRMMPGKADFKKHGGEKVQKKYLNDYLGNLHEKYRAENPETKIGKALFCSLRPSYILPASFASR